MDVAVFSVSEAVGVINQTMEYAYPTMTVVGELSGFKVSKGRWVYADLKDATAKLRLFGTIYMLPGPLEDGMMVEVIAEPRLHPLYGFSLNCRTIRPVGEGSIKKAANLLQAKLEAEGLFAVERKRSLPYAPARVGLIASEQSAAYADFMKITDARWAGTDIQLFDVTVQGESAPETLIEAIQFFNQQAEPVEVLVMIRGGGSADDLAAFSTEQVTRAVAGSRIPMLVAIGHEIDVSLAELAADMRASTPSNAAELLFPDKQETKRQLKHWRRSLDDSLSQALQEYAHANQDARARLQYAVELAIERRSEKLKQAKTLLESMHPRSSLKRGYALVQANGKLVSSVTSLRPGTKMNITLQDGRAETTVDKVQSD